MYGGTEGYVGGLAEMLVVQLPKAVSISLATPLMQTTPWCRVEEKVHRVQGYVHDKREHAREEAERGMFTADDITEVAAQFAQTRK